MPLENARDAPSAENLIHRPVKRKLTLASEWWFIGDLPDQGVGRIEIRQAVICAGTVRVLVHVDARAMTVSSASIERFRPRVIRLKRQTIGHPLLDTDLQRV